MNLAGGGHAEHPTCLADATTGLVRTHHQGAGVTRIARFLLDQPCKTAGVVTSEFGRAIDGPASDLAAHLRILQIPVLQIAHHAADALAFTLDIAGHKGVVSGRVVHHIRAHHTLRMADQAAHPLVAFDQTIGVAAVLNVRDRLLQVAHHATRAAGVCDVCGGNAGDRTRRGGAAHRGINEPARHAADRVHASHSRRGFNSRQGQERATAAPGITQHAPDLAVAITRFSVVVLTAVIVFRSRVVVQVGTRNRARAADAVEAAQPA